MTLFAQSADNELTSLVEQIQSARKTGNMDEADNLASRFQTLADLEDNSVRKADAHYEIARNAMERNQYVDAQANLQKSIEHYQTQGNRKKLADAYRQLGLTYRYQSSYPQALEYIYLAMQIYQQLQDKRALSSTHNSIGVVLEKMGQYEEASQAHQKALAIDHELGDQQGIASAFYNLGDIHRVLGDHQLALNYFQDAMAIDVQAGDTKNIAYSHNKIGYQFNTLGDTEQARFHINEALRLFKQIETPRDTDWALTSLAQLELDSGNFSTAEKIINGVIDRAILNKYNSLLVDAYQVAARIAFQQEDTSKALELIDVGAKQAKLNQERHDEAIFEALRVEVHMHNDSLKQALNALQRQKVLEDEILNANRLDTIAKVQAQTEFIRQDQQIALLKKEKALQLVTMEQHRLSRNLWLLSVVSGFILAFLLYWRVVQRRLNIKLIEQVEERTFELEQKNTELQHAYQQMEVISLTDKLTGIHNRRFLENQIDSDLDQSARLYEDWRLGKTDKPEHADIVAFMIDMDHFKLVNDLHGHGAGDAVLQQFTDRMAEVFRQSDYLVRWGGEEFVAVARFINRQDAPVLAQRLMDAVRLKPFELSKQRSASYTCSIGYASFPHSLEKETPTDWQTLISIADSCSYAAKFSGRDSWIGSEMLLEDIFPVAEITPAEIGNWAAQNKIRLKSSFLDVADIRWKPVEELNN